MNLRLFRILCAMLLFTFLMILFRLRVKRPEKLNFAAPLLSAKTKVDKWIVILTNSLPTDAVRTFADQEGWRVVVVADKTTPTDWDYFNCDFLSIEKQKALNYAITQHLPANNYARKMIGYLYAIEKGAQWIYDADDQIVLTAETDHFDFKPVISGLTYDTKWNANGENSNNIFNPYAYFGQQNMWPRGYPLEEIKHQNKEENFQLCKNRRTPLIQQGLVAKEPDVDAIYRLVYNKNTKGNLNIDFDSRAPPILLEYGTFGPFNSQNTLFHRDAFWALFLPVSVAFRASDIWRSYFVQKLLHLTGNTLGFYPVNAKKYSNEKSLSLMTDFKDERTLHENTGKLIKFLSNWTCTKSTLEKCILQLSKAFSTEGFWTNKDVELTERWVADLKAMKYHFPSLINPVNDSLNCRKAFLQFPTNDMEQRTKAEQKSFAELEKWCTKRESQPLKTGVPISLPDKGIFGKLRRETALIITGNHAFGPWISLLQRLHEPFFAIVIFCGPVYRHKIFPLHEVTGFPPVTQFNFINVTENEMDAGYRAYVCTSKAIEMRMRSIAGFVVMSDDTVYNFWNDLDLSRFRLDKVGRQNGLPWWSFDVGLAAMNRTIEILRNRTTSEPDSDLAIAWNIYSDAVGGDGFALLSEQDVWGLSDWYYLPKTNESVFYELAEVFFEARLFHEIAVPKIGAALQWLNFYKTTNKTDIGNCLHIWKKDRDVWEQHYNKDLIYFHPVKLSFIGHTASDRLNYCKHIIVTFQDAILNSTKEDHEAE